MTLRVATTETSAKRISVQLRRKIPWVSVDVYLVSGEELWVKPRSCTPCKRAAAQSLWMRFTRKGHGFAVVVLARKQTMQGHGKTRLLILLSGSGLDQLF